MLDSEGDASIEIGYRVDEIDHFREGFPVDPEFEESFFEAFEREARIMAGDDISIFAVDQNRGDHAPRRCFGELRHIANQMFPIDRESHRFPNIRIVERGALEIEGEEKEASHRGNSEESLLFAVF